MSSKRVKQECLAGVSSKSVQQECQGRVSKKSVQEECPARVSSKNVQQECPARVSSRSVLSRVSSRSVTEECPARVSSKSVQQECPARVSRKSVVISMFVAVYSAPHKVTAFGFVGSISFFHFFALSLFFGSIRKELKKWRGGRGPKSGHLGFRCFAKVFDASPLLGLFFSRVSFVEKGIKQNWEKGGRSKIKQPPRFW